jgi:predicted transcriptional regulator
MYNFPELKQIKIKRKALGLTQQYLAKQAHISQSLLAKLEAGQVVPNYYIAKRLFEKLEEVENYDSKKAFEVMNPKVIKLKPEDKISKVIKIAIKHGISQFPVEQNGEIIGSITTSDMLDVEKNAKVSECMSGMLPTVGKDMPVEVVKSIVKSSSAVLVVESGKIIGIITAEELL